MASAGGLPDDEVLPGSSGGRNSPSTPVTAEISPLNQVLAVDGSRSRLAPIPAVASCRPGSSRARVDHRRPGQGRCRPDEPGADGRGRLRQRGPSIRFGLRLSTSVADCSGQPLLERQCEDLRWSTVIRSVVVVSIHGADPEGESLTVAPSGPPVRKPEELPALSPAPTDVAVAGHPPMPL